MARANLFGNQNSTVERSGVIVVTKRTVRFAKNVYQTHNIVAFSEGDISIGKIPWWLVVAVFLSGLAINSVNQSMGILLILLGVGGIVWNFLKPKHYGLQIVLNSGDKKMFVTKDTGGLRQAIAVIYDFIEFEKDATYQISINNSQVTGNLVQGDARDVSLKPMVDMRERNF